jgi:alanyl-tRNA synthetase
MCISQESIEKGTKLSLFAVVTDSAQQRDGLKANEWVNSVLSKVGGRGGGKLNMAQGSVTLLEQESIKRDVVLHEASRFVENYTKTS